MIQGGKSDMDTASLEPKFRKPAPYDRANIFSKVIFG